MGAFDDLPDAPKKPKATAANRSDFARLITGKPKEMGVMDAIGRELGLGGRAAIRGVYDLTTLFGGDLLNAAESKVRGAPVRTQRQNADWLADKLGLPYPETLTERVGGDVTGALVGGGGLLGIGRGLATRTPGLLQGVGEALSAQPATQVAGNVTGSSAAGVTRESGGGTGAQLTAGLLGGLAPGVGLYAGASGVRGAVRGGEAGRQQLERAAADFRAAGTTPTVGQASGNPAIRATEVALSRLPGGAGVIARKAQQQAEEIGAGVRGLADELAPGADPTTAGRAIRQGIVGPGGFAERTGAVSNRLYSTLDDIIPPATPVDVPRTVAALDDLNPVIPGAPNLTPLFQNSRIAAIKEAALADAAPSGGGLMGVTSPRLPYQGVQKTRTLVGKELQNANFASDVPVGDWRQLYGGLSDDMRAAAQAQGPEAARAFKRANDYFRATQSRNEAIRHVVNQDTPEAIFTAATSGTDKGATTLNALMKSLPDKSRREVAAAVLDRMGRAVGSQQNAEGTAFSTQTFLTNWAKLSPRARSVLFDRFGADFRRRVESITRVSDNLREGSKIYANPSGTSGGIAQGATYTALGASAIPALGGNFVPLAGVTGGIAGGNLLGRLLTRPQSVDWLSQSTQTPYGLLGPAAIMSQSGQR